MSQVHAATHPGMLGSYDLCERLGIGGLGELWRAYDRARGLEVALKILAAHRAWRRRLDTRVLAGDCVLECERPTAWSECDFGLSDRAVGRQAS